ncbi:hypothetical protein D3C86_1873420 [compost metagenome]
MSWLFSNVGWMEKFMIEIKIATDAQTFCAPTGSAFIIWLSGGIPIFYRCICGIKTSPIDSVINTKSYGSSRNTTFVQ